jgi:hypothetical protein
VYALGLQKKKTKAKCNSGYGIFFEVLRERQGNKDTEKSIGIRVTRKETNGMTQSKTVSLGTERHKEERKEIVKN